MEFERLNLFHNKYGKTIREIWSCDIRDVVTTYKARSFKGETYFQYTLSCYDKEYHRTQANFVFMNPEVFLITRVFQLKVLKHKKMEHDYLRVADFLRAYVCDFGKIDVELHSSIA